MGRHISCSMAMFFVILTFSGLISAQESSINAGILQFIEGEAFVDGNAVLLAKDTIRFFQTGQTLSTKQGRVELVFASYANWSLGENSSLRMEQSSPDGTELSLEKGFILIEVVQKLTKPIRIRISNSTVEMRKPGLYRLDSSPWDLRVYGGTALADNGSHKARVKGEMEIGLDGDLSETKFDRKASDSFHQWSAHRSFDIFLVNSETDNWKWKGPMPTAQNPTPAGFFVNSNYGVLFTARMPPKYAQRVRPMHGMDWDKTAHDAEDRLKKERDLQQEQEADRIRQQMEQQIGKQPPHP